MYNSLQTGLDTAKGLATAWGIPLVGVNHMQAHALTPRLVSSLNGSTAVNSPAFPFLSLLVSGGNTMLLHSTGLCEHKILAEQTDTPIGNALDHCARDILPKDVLPTSATVSYGPLLESFAFPNKEADYNYDPPKTQGILNQEKATEWGWAIRPPLSKNFPRKMEYSYSGLGAIVRRIAEAKPKMDETERRGLARETMKVAFEHLASRVLLAMDRMKADGHVIPGALVVSGGVAANRFLRYVLRAVLDVRGYDAVEVVFPPMELCTDNAAMIAWAGMEMFEAGYQTDMDATAIRKWSIDPASKEGGILGVGRWARRL
jgi:N6-L-threonylcarbamoyladenine synthase